VDRCEGLLKDYCGDIAGRSLPSSALWKNGSRLSLNPRGNTAMTPEAMRARLVQRLEDNRGLAPEIANYAVDTWSYALGVGLGAAPNGYRTCPWPCKWFRTGRIGCRKGCGGSAGRLNLGGRCGGATGCG